MGALVGIDEDRPKRRLSLKAKAVFAEVARAPSKEGAAFADRIIADELAANSRYFNPSQE